ALDESLKNLSTALQQLGQAMAQRLEEQREEVRAQLDQEIERLNASIEESRKHIAADGTTDVVRRDIAKLLQKIGESIKDAGTTIDPTPNSGADQPTEKSEESERSTK